MKIKYIAICLVLLCCIIGTASAAEDISTDVVSDSVDDVAVDAVQEEIDDSSTVDETGLTVSDDTTIEEIKNLGFNDNIIDAANIANIKLKIGNIITSDVFDVYVDFDKFIKNFEEKEYLASEMEAFALFYLAELLNKEAACLLTVVDSKYEPGVIISPEQRQNSLDEMIRLSLLASIK